MSIIVLYTALVVLVSVLVSMNIYHAWFLADVRRRGKLPPRGTSTMFDVRHLLMEGKKDLAIQLYCEIFQTTPIKAKKDVEELERSLII